MFETSEPTLFRVNADQYVSIVNPNIDFENRDQRTFSVQVTVREKDNPSESSSAVLSVNVLDINDNTPTFERTSYPATIDPGTGVRNVTLVSVGCMLCAFRFLVLTYVHCLCR